ncbi:YsnF/AvaK domain-containing protein [Occallatibacter riparius]|uniref:YsnF/AvaK domain-containing protein n=1 Tax=Occallatibacter riparius TaxID=1002689 RepID=A0A9J7BSY9_9BACT|nr:YsnF/AvaK domain-containing protein [Occallatibacter riparius]UWZ86019.1 YsnF/AvaK domain-containing protein [Occallatibacter riparius]
MAGYETDTTVFGYFSSETQAEAAVRELKAAGFTRNQISVAGQPGTGAYSSGTTTGESTTGSKMREEGHKAGEAVGGFWDRIKNFFEGDTAEPYADERTSGDMATHEITGSNNVYDYDDDLHESWGTTTDRSRYFGQQYGSTGQGYIVSVRAAERRAEAETILESNGADLGSSAESSTALTPDYASSNSSYSGTGTGTTSPYAETEDAAYTGSTGSDLDTRTPRRIQLYGEVLRVHRDRVQRGEARIRKETVTETQNVEVPVTREELVVERVPVSGSQPATGATFGSDSEEIRVPLTEEVARVEKEPVVREQVEIGKREITNTENRQETVRREELRVDEDKDRLRKAS